MLPIIGSNAMMSGAVVNKFSFNIIGGYSGGIDGFEFGAMFNIVKTDMRGFQFGGFANIVGRDVDGFQFGGFANNVQGKVSGFQFAGFSNVVFDTLSGFQISGFNNIVMADARGTQLAGFDNVCTGKSWVQLAGFVNISVDQTNIQLSGFANHAGGLKGIQASGFVSSVSNEARGAQFAGFANSSTGELRGVQVAGYVNVADTVKGAQISGFINVANKASGVQIGLINISDSLQGVPIGLFSYSKKGYHVVEVFGSDFSHANLTFKTGTNYLYNIYQFGARFDGAITWYNAGLGYGTRIPLSKNKKWFVNIGAVGSLYNDGTLNAAISLLGTGSLDIEFKPKKHLAIFAGPTYNYLIIDRSIASEYDVAQNFMMPIQNTTYTTYADNYEWVGFKVGVRF
ncbi:MAG: hypothetical protein JKY42_07570 [Flavobacteriales bacterium]|nr:hypothetical protein [Flavobacteriales bacterium]